MVFAFVVEELRSSSVRRPTKDMLIIRDVGPSTPTSAEFTLMRGNRNVRVFDPSPTETSSADSVSFKKRLIRVASSKYAETEP